MFPHRAHHKGTSEAAWSISMGPQLDSLVGHSLEWLAHSTFPVVGLGLSCYLFPFLSNKTRYKVALY